MSTIQTNIQEKVYSIKRWLGVNEAQEGEASLKLGEAAAMRNFRVTAGGALQKRPGSATVAGLNAHYELRADEEPRTLRTESARSSAVFPMYPGAVTDSVGKPLTTGTVVNVNAENASHYAGYYTRITGALYQFDSCRVTERTARESHLCRYAGMGYAGEGSVVPWFLACDDVTWNGEHFSYTNPQVVWNPEDAFGKYTVMQDIGSPVYLLRGMNNRPNPWELTGLAAPGIIATFDYWDDNEESYWDQDRDPWFRLCFQVTTWNERRFDWLFRLVRSTLTHSSPVRGLWSGFVGGREVLCAACDGYLWELELTGDGWRKVSCGALDTSQDVSMFGFDKKLYLLNGVEYMVWDGTTLSRVEGYRPLVTVSALPPGGGTALQQVNKLTGARRCRFSPDGAATVFHLPEKGLASLDWVKNLVTGDMVPAGQYTANLDDGTVTFTTAPEEGTNTIEIAWTMGTDYREQVTAMRFAELYNGAQDTRVFLYGDGSNKALYSGLDSDGQPRADYFPDLNEAAVGDENTPITAMIRHYNRLLCFKLDSTWSMYYDAITLPDGTVTAGFYVSPVNRDVGNCAPGQARLVENRPWTLDGRSVIEWKATNTSGNITGDQRNAQRVSQRVDRSVRSFDLTTARTFYDKITHEFYILGEGGVALVYNVEADAWYGYTDFPATCMINYKDEVYYGSDTGDLRHFSTDYLSDDGEAVRALWESGAMDFGADFRRKYSAMLWLGIRPEEAGYLAVTAKTDRKDDFAEYAFTTRDAGAVPEMNRVKLKAKKFTYYKLILRSDQVNAAATVVSADLRVRGTGYVR